LLHDLTQFALDSDAAVSKGFVRGNLMPFRLGENAMGGDQAPPTVSPASLP
jgi:hypothetical protein